LSFTAHCSEIARQASRVANLIFRIFRSKDHKIYLKAYKSYVRPKLEYASPVWYPRLISNVNILENVQRRFTKRVFRRCFPSEVRNDSYSQRLEVLSLPTLEIRRAHADLLMVHDLVHHQPQQVLESFFSLSSNRTRGHEKRLVVKNFIPRTGTILHGELEKLETHCLPKLRNVNHDLNS